MQISLQSSARKRWLKGISFLIAATFIAACFTEFLANYLFSRGDPVSLQRAVRLQPGNAEYFDRLGVSYTLPSFFPAQALAAFQKAVQLDPHRSRFWLDLADAYQEVNNKDQQTFALERAIAVDPRAPEVAWMEANLYAARQEVPFALKQIRTVLESTPYLAPSALSLAWRINPDIDGNLQQVIPADPKTYHELLGLLMSKGEKAAAQKTWEAMVHLQQPIERQAVFDYVRYLIMQSDVDQAAAAWRQASSLSGLSAYQPAPQNLIVNGDFSLDILNGGFDWLYSKSNDVSLALDPTEVFNGRRSLKIKFDSRAIEDAGIRQLVPVQPNTSYEFSSYFKAADMEGAGGPRIVLQDVYDQSLYFAGDEIKDTDDWKQISGTVTTGPNSKLLVVRIQRVPPGRPIRGKVWIDNLSLTAEPK
jgi:tetratricopeptide (TPR) repeat protein